MWISYPDKENYVNPLIPSGNKKSHAYLNKPAAERSAFKYL